MTAQILVADHDPLVREQCRRFLVARGYDVAVAADGLQCIHQLQSCSPDLLLLDPQILWGGGPGVLEWLTTEEPVKPLNVILTEELREGRLPRRLCGKAVKQLQRPSGLSTMLDFVGQLQRLLPSHPVPTRRPRPHRKSATR